MKLIFYSPFLLLGLLLLSVNSASAHVIVKPDQVGIAAEETFTVNVPAERAVPTVALKLLLPTGLSDVVPNIHPGWQVSLKKSTSDSAQVTEIDWLGGTIPAGERDQFNFSAQVPATPTILEWKAYQTYADGVVVSWDQDPKLGKGPDDDSITPYSTTSVVNDLTPTATSPLVTPLWLGIVATLLSILSLFVALRRN